MSKSNKKRQTRKQKAVQSQPPPATVPVQATPETKSSNKTLAEQKSARQQVSKTIGIELSVSRCRSYIDRKNVNEAVESCLAQLKEGKALSDEHKALIERAYSEVYDTRVAKDAALRKRLSESKNTADKKRLADLPPVETRTNSVDEKCKYVSKLRCRFSNAASVVLASGLDYVSQVIARHAMTCAKEQKKSIIKVKHALGSGFEDLSVYPLLRSLPVVLAAQEELNTTSEQTEGDDEQQPTSETPGQDGANIFSFYISSICRNVKEQLQANDSTYENIRISREIREFCSSVVVQLITRIAPLVKLYVDTAKVKTVDSVVICFVFRCLLTDSVSQDMSVVRFMEEKLERYNQKNTSTV